MHLGKRICQHFANDWSAKTGRTSNMVKYYPSKSVARLPTLEDEQALFADADASCCIARLKDAGVKEIVVKRGPLGCLIDAEGGLLDIPPHKAVRPVDTTAAGDSFNAGYLAARIGGASPIDAGRAGHRLTGIRILTPGAIIAREAMPKNIVKTGAYS